MFRPVAQKINFPAIEERVLAFWKDHDIFHKSLRLRHGAPRYVFFEGPPTANGTPHNGHVLTRVIKDLFPRYKTMRGFEVPRKAGWDTHGLPVEVEVEKELGIHGKSEIEAYGVEAFTRKCIDSVFRYTDVWERLSERIGFWVDLDDAYVTYHKSYVESVWWALSTLFERGLLYQGHKVIWWWPQGGTALSSGEVGLGYREVDDPSVTVRFRVRGEADTSFLAWTTTPWTLPSNCGLTISTKLEYSWARVGGEVVILATELLDTVLAKHEYTVERTALGSALLGMEYEPLFDFGEPVSSGRLHVVIPGDFVTTSAGTGIVHTAPAFGEDDHRVAQAEGLAMLQLIEPDGTFVAEAGEFAGRFCKDADRDIIRDLKARGLLFAESTYRHDYPFCWRASEDPLIQYARPAWFIRTTDVIDRAIANNQAVGWLPEHIKDGRFGDFLNNNVDWALSRERYWGTPLPIWICEDEGCDARHSPPSAAAIEARNPHAFDAFRAAQEADPSLSDHLAVHKPWIDEVTMPCEACGATMRRVPEVIDCWFDSGCMPFAQWGYPHKNQETFRASFPADFISEAIDQTRGWFYSLLMISTLLFDDADEPSAFPHPYKNCIVLGHVCDKHGKKESKSLGNYTAPDAILATSGADAIRWHFYSANPPYNNTRYSPEAVRQAQKEFLIKLHNVYGFFVIYANIDGFDPGLSPRRAAAERPKIDRWLLSEVHLTVREVTALMDGYRIYESAQRIITLTDALSNWYVRRNRDRFWASDKTADKWDAYHTLHEALVTMSQLIAPFVPFFAEEVYGNLAAGADDAAESVHLCDWPEADERLIDEALSEEMQAVRDIVSLGLSTRAMHKLKVRQPLREAEVILGKAHLAERVRPYVRLIAEELNVKAVVFTQDAGGRVAFSVKPNYRVLGRLFGKRMPALRKALDAADADRVREAFAAGRAFVVDLDGEAIELTHEQVEVSVTAEAGFAASGGAAGTVILNAQLDEELIGEGIAREIVSRVQKLRKDQNLEYTARIEVTLRGDPVIEAAARTHAEAIAGEVLATSLDVGAAPLDGAIVSETKIDKKPMVIGVRPAA